MHYIVTVHITETRKGAVDVCVEAADAASAKKMALAQSTESFFYTTGKPARRLTAEVPLVLELTPTDIRGIEAMLNALPYDTFVDLMNDGVHSPDTFSQSISALIKRDLGLRSEFAPLVLNTLRTMELPAGWRRTKWCMLKTDANMFKTAADVAKPDANMSKTSAKVA